MSENKIENKTTLGASPAQVPQYQYQYQENGIKRCGYCDMLVRWTSADGGKKNVATNADGSRHHCLANGTAKRKEPLKHDRPTAQEVISFLNSAREGSAAGPVAGAGGNASGTSSAYQSLPNHHQTQQQQQEPLAIAIATGNSSSKDDHDAAIMAMHGEEEANIVVAAWKAQAEATNRLADAMVEVARSVDALAGTANNIATSNYRLSDELSKLTHLIRGIVAASSSRKGSSCGSGVDAA